MYRAFFVLFTAALGSFAVALAAELPVAPKPRMIRPDGSRDPAPKPEPAAKAENPADIVDRIIKNSKEASDKLAMTDTGPDTLKRQDKVLSDIDALLNPPKPEHPEKKEPPKDNMPNPMMMPDPMMPEPKMNPDPKPKPKDKDNMPMGGMGMPDPMPMPMGMNEPGPRRPRMGDPMADKKDDGPKPNKPEPEPKMPMGGAKDPKDPNPKPVGTGGTKPLPKSLLPFENGGTAKEEWGHLPDKMRQQMPLYFKEDFMQRYEKLLKLYYSDERTGMPKR